MYIAGVRWQHRFESSKKKKNNRGSSYRQCRKMMYLENFIAKMHSPSLISSLTSSSYWHILVNIINFDWKNKFLRKNPSRGNCSTITQWFTIPFKSFLCLFRKEKNAWKENDGKGGTSNGICDRRCNKRAYRELQVPSRIYYAFNERQILPYEIYED